MVEGLAPPTRAVVHSHDTICRRLRIQYASLHMCGVNQFWIIVFLNQNLFRHLQHFSHFFPRLCLNNFWFQIFTNFIGNPLYEEFLDIICHSLLYFAILTYINEL